MDKESKTLYIVMGLIVIVLIGLVIVFAGNGSSNNGSNTELAEDAETIMNNLQVESSQVTDEQKGEFGKYISVGEYLDLYNREGEYSLVFLARPTCGYCELASPVVQKIIKDNSIYISYLNTDDFSEEDQTNFVQSNEVFNDGFGTPMLLLVGEGKILDYIDGATDTAHYKEFLIKYKFIKE